MEKVLIAIGDRGSILPNENWAFYTKTMPATSPTDGKAAQPAEDVQVLVTIQSGCAAWLLSRIWTSITKLSEMTGHWNWCKPPNKKSGHCRPCTWFSTR